MSRRKPPAAVVRIVPRGIWLGASDVLNRPCPVGEPYPHIHYRTFTTSGGREVTVMPQDCAACHAERVRKGSAS